MWTIITISLAYLSNINGLLHTVQLPCDFVDSINITGGVEFSNNSILFEGIVYNQYATVNFIWNGTKQTQVEPHIRGCPCLQTPCIRLCCPYGSFVELFDYGSVQKCHQSEEAKHFESEVIQYNETKTIRMEEHFGFVDPICNNYYYADDFKIYTTGEILHASGLATQREYCLKVSKNRNSEIELEAMICIDDVAPGPKVVIPYGMLMSVFFIIATLLLRFCLSKVKTDLRGKCFVCYLICMVIAFMALSWVHFNGSNYVGSFKRKCIATLIYFFILSAASWLSVTCFELWSSFKAPVVNLSPRDLTKFQMYRAYAFDPAIMLVVIGHILDFINLLPNYLKPGIGTETCFLKESSRISKFLFFYLPLCITSTMSSVFLILSVIRAYKIKSEPNKYEALDDPRTFWFWWSLLVILTAVWAFEVLSFIFPDNDFFLFTDIFNASQGIIIFILFVVKKLLPYFETVRKLERWA